MIEHSIDSGNGRNADRTGRKALVAVGVERAVHRQMLVIDALKFKAFQGELHRGVCLQGHVFGKSVKIHLRYHGLLSIV